MCLLFSIQSLCTDWEVLTCPKFDITRVRTNNSKSFESSADRFDQIQMKQVSSAWLTLGGQLVEDSDQKIDF